MGQRRARPYGSWASPISVEMAVSGSLALREPRFDGDELYWIEGRPQERGRQVVVRWSPEQGARDVTPTRFNVRTMAHEYGGGPYAVAARTVFFSNFADGRVYRQRSDRGEATPLTPEAPYRYADLVVDARRGRLIAVREDHSAPDGTPPTTNADGRTAEPQNTLVAIPISAAAGGATQPVAVLASGHDFYSTPRLSPDGARLAWVCWRHPNMPWDASELWLAEVPEDGSLVGARRLAGGSDESVAQPEWAPDGSLVFASDRSGWWNLYRLEFEGAAPADPRPLAPMEAEFAGPQWVFGMSWYDIADDGTIVALARRAGRDELWLVPTGGRPGGGTQAERIDVPDEQIHSLRASGRQVAYIGASAIEPSAIVLLDVAAGARRVVRRSAQLSVDAAYLSRPEPISFPTSAGATAHALYYRPTNPDFEGQPGERPPLVVMSHGGPTSHAGGGLSIEKQVFTSRGFAVVDVDYRGSSGYGRAYMRALDGQWGIADVEDCINAARYLAEAGEVDRRRLAIRGGSAGGYTTLCALVFHDVFAAGASHFGVGDLEALARDTHKFESRYLDRLVAPYPEGVETYRERSPINFPERLTTPLIVLQGLDDKVVPPAQAEALVDALRQRGIAHAYLPFEGEGHGFRQADNIRRALEGELSFYAQVFGFELADEIEPVRVEFLRVPEQR